MNTPYYDITPKRKPKYRNMLLVIIGIILCLFLFRLITIYNNRTAQNGSSDNANTDSTGLFSPLDVITLMNNFSYDYVAGECTHKRFVSDNSIIHREGDRTADVYRYFYYQGSRPSIVDTMKERITMWSDMDNTLVYTFKKKEPYEKFIQYFRKNNGGEIPIEDRAISFKKRPHYISNGFIWIDVDYLIDYDGYCVYICSKDELQKINKEPETSKEPEVNNEPTAENGDQLIVYTSVNLTHVYDDIISAEINNSKDNLLKGTKLTVIRTVGEYYYCDYLKEDGTPSTGYVRTEDVQDATLSN